MDPRRESREKAGHTGRRERRAGAGAIFGLAPLLPLLLLVSLLPVAPEALSRSPRGPSMLVIEPGLLAKLRALADGLHREIVLCLEGTVRTDTAVARDFFMPEPQLSSTMRSVARPCPRGTLATWHNHPLPGWGSGGGAGWGSGGGAFDETASGDTRRAGAAAALCVLSETDVRTAARLGHPFVVVAVDGETWCSWTLAQVKELASRLGP